MPARRALTLRMARKVLADFANPCRDVSLSFARRPWFGLDRRRRANEWGSIRNGCRTQPQSRGFASHLLLDQPKAGRQHTSRACSKRSRQFFARALPAWWV